jgi:hypothetical protein
MILAEAIDTFTSVEYDGYSFFIPKSTLRCEGFKPSMPDGIFL